ncbi:hypothetical protein AAVH_06529 [Aphelenchoides avenae]|nr:hypothetical protein AAVH_06529 [Aphelenchus avenae]
MSLKQAEKRLITAKVKHDEVSKAYDSIGKKYTAIAQDYFRASSELHEAKKGYELALTLQGNILKPQKCHSDDDEHAASPEKTAKDSPAVPTAHRGKRKIGDARRSTAPSIPTMGRDASPNAHDNTQKNTAQSNPTHKKPRTHATPVEDPGSKKIAVAATAKINVLQPSMPLARRKRSAVSSNGTTSTPSVVNVRGSCKALGHTEPATCTQYPVKTDAKSVEPLGKRVRSPKKRFPCECA